VSNNVYAVLDNINQTNKRNLFMKKQMKYIIVLFAVLIAQGCLSEKIENDCIKKKLKGKVKSFT
jgi:hypothetical protein